MKKRNFLPAFVACFQLGPLPAQTETTPSTPDLAIPPAEVKVQLLPPKGGGLVEAAAVVVEQNTAPASVTLPTTNPSTEQPVTAPIKDPSNLILEANKIADQLPAQVLATRMSRGRYEVRSIGSGSMNDFEYSEQRLVDPKIAAREDYQQVKAAFDEARKAFDDARKAFDQNDMVKFFSARVVLTEKLLGALELIESAYGEIRKKASRTVYDIETQNHFVRFADAIRTDLAGLRKMIGSTSNETVEAIDKAVYGFDDNFEVFNLKHISENAPAIALIRDKTKPGTAIGTAFLIGKNTVATAEHCVAAYRNHETMHNLEFIFFHEFDFAGGVAVEREKIACDYKESDREKYGSEQENKKTFGVPDFAVVQISPPPAKQAIIEAIKPVTLSQRRTLYADALCCIGHPQGHQKKIHMNCRVLLPFELRPKERGSFASTLAARIGKLDKIVQNRSDRGRPTDREGDLIREHYTSDENAAGNDDLLYHVDRSQRSKRPAIAIEADTFPGDSGAPIFDIRTNAVIGLLVAGQPTTNKAIEEVSLEEHEIALPIQFLISAMGGPAAIESLGGSILRDPNNP